jgi:hypothetical protein
MSSSSNSNSSSSYNNNNNNKNNEQLQSAQRKVILGGAVSLFLGLVIAGLPYTLVIFRDHAIEWSPQEQEFLTTDFTMKFLLKLAKNQPGTERAWRMAHLEGITNGLVAWVLAGILHLLKLSNFELNALAHAIAITAISNPLASIIAATYNVRGFHFGGGLANKITCSLFSTAIGTCIYSLYLIVKGVW